MVKDISLRHGGRESRGKVTVYFKKAHSNLYLVYVYFIQFKLAKFWYICFNVLIQAICYLVVFIYRLNSGAIIC